MNQQKFFEEAKSILKPGGKLLIVEPKLFHVSKTEFEAMIKKAEEIGLKPVERPKVFLGKTVLLKSGK